MTPRPIHPLMKTVLEFGPLLVFFVLFLLWRDTSFTVAGRSYGGFIAATAVFVPVLALATLLQWRITGHLSAMQIATLVLVVVFGGLSVWLNDPRFFKLKPTLIYLLFAAILGFGLMRGKAWLALVMSEALPMREPGWTILTRRMIGLFLGLAVANEVIWRSQSDTFWVNFKTFGLPAIMFIFLLLQARLFSTYGIEKPKE
ncbi:inner membrane-spanning protein YciB [Paracoccus sp. p4-l81]|uniref:inner membrane-spanning protein YciB n=1 Tax=unclassified Paracoccus (in: a-proteobacteria) TaxID=2688777 RepID=UPI0035BB0929